jgi:hypothetical protein
MNTDNLRKFDFEKSKFYTKFMNLGGIKSLPKSYNKIRKFLDEKDNEYLAGLKLELENSFFNKYFFYPGVYKFVCKKLKETKETKKNLADMFYTMSLTK